MKSRRSTWRSHNIDQATMPCRYPHVNLPTGIIATVCGKFFWLYAMHKLPLRCSRLPSRLRSLWRDRMVTHAASSSPESRPLRGGSAATRNAPAPMHRRPDEEPFVHRDPICCPQGRRSLDNVKRLTFWVKAATGRMESLNRPEFRATAIESLSLATLRRVAESS